MKIHPTRTGARGGFTLLEMTLALTILGVIGYALVGAVDMGNDSSQRIMIKAGANADLRQSATWLTDELVMSDGDTISVNVLPDGNHELEFREPITVGAVETWGVSEPLLGTQADWFIRYTVEAGGQGDRRLVRQVVDDNDTVQTTRVVAEGLRSGAAQPGFTCVQTGDVWVLTIRTAADQASEGKETVFHVHVRN